ncbi:hypothetical protein CLV77_1948 [Brevirhabdus pacifica]|uniref:DUF6314 family protein n=1 Tax=Brevirhabdus pacifica TaxID=1267768 RepID=UPI000C1C5E98|nr:DUF6314 family protein [Brevirhabdus pacifica]PJJ87380.1 hypothetical protein CLV77_1948 [Brevirhabdus pacifica]
MDGRRNGHKSERAAARGADARDPDDAHDAAPGGQVLTPDAFIGRWRLDRRIHDRLTGQESRLEGEAVMRPQGADIAYDEEGRLEFPGQPPMIATRSYLWQPDGDGVWVFFEDGRPFHRFSLALTMPEASHHCPPDMYYVSYNFTRWPSWGATWTVRGPRKDYRIESSYTRLG